MKRIFGVIALFLLVFSVKAQDVKNLYVFDKINNTIEFDITKIALFEQRTHFLYMLNNDERFDVSLGSNDGVFVIKRNKNSYDCNLESTFNDFFKGEMSAFKSMSKDEVGELYGEWKASLPDLFNASMMMDIYVKDRQNNHCADADPFCTDVGIYEFPAGVNAGSGESGPNYDCLHSTPNPAWYYMRMANSGGMTIHMYSTPSEDIDFCCWGPFEDPVTPCPNGLTLAKRVSCSYSSSATENCTIPNNAQTGEYYILIITNYSNDPCNITFSKTAGTGTTDCSILDPFLTANTPCYGGTLTLTADNIDGATYQWTGPDNQTHNGRTWTRNNATLSMAGTYTCHVATSTQSGTETINVYVLPNVTANFTHGDAIAGMPIQFTGTETTNPSGHNSEITTRQWNFGDGGTSTSANPTHTYNAPGTYNVTYTVAITGGNEGNCSDSKTIQINVQSSMATTITGDNVVCQYESITLNVNATGGTGSYHYAWKKNGTSVGSDDPTLTLRMNEAGSFTFTCEVSDGFTTQTPSHNVIVNALPTAYAGEDQTINFDNSTTLEAGYIEGASYSWQPADSIAGNNNQRTVQTKSLKGNTQFTVTVTHNGCVAQDDMVVSVGAEMTASVSIDDNEICENESTTVTAVAVGGNPSDYSFSWEPADEVALPHSASSYVYPSLTTDHFTCTISDGHTTLVKTVNITVHPLPIANAGEDFPIYYNTSATLTAEEVPGASYEWLPKNMIQNGDNEHQTVTTVPLTEETEFTLRVTRNDCWTEDRITVFAGNQLQGKVEAEDNSICQFDGETVMTATAFGGNESYTYTWTSSRPGTFSDEHTASTTFSNPTESGEYVLHCSIFDGETTIDRSTTINVNAQPEAAVTVAGVTSIDEIPSVVVGETLTMEALYVEGATYIWEPSDKIMNTLENGRIATTYPLTDIGFNDFTVTVKTQTATNNYCTNITSLRAKVYANISASFETSQDSICEHDILTLSANATGGTGNYKYTWSPAEYFNNNTGQTVSTKALPNVGMIKFICNIEDVDLANAHATTDKEIIILEAPRVNYDILGEALVEAGNEFYPFVYEYSIDTASLSGFEIDSIIWEIKSYYDTPNQLDPVTQESLWLCVPDPNPENPKQPKKAYVYITEEGNAKLSCRITAKCGMAEARIIIFTDGYEYDDYSVYELNYDDLISIYPNPNDGDLYIDFGEELTSPINVSIYNYSGMMQLQFDEGTMSKIVHYSIKGLADGLYYVRITGKDFAVTKKIVLIK